MTTTVEGSALVLHGTASDAEFELFATALAGELE
jgi:hypothetical protein